MKKPSDFKTRTLSALAKTLRELIPPEHLSARGITPKKLSHIENGEKNIRISTLLDISRRSGVSLYRIFDIMKKYE